MYLSKLKMDSVIIIVVTKIFHRDIIYIYIKWHNIIYIKEIKPWDMEYLSYNLLLSPLKC